MASEHGRDSISLLLGRVCKLHHARVRALFHALGLYRGQPPLLFALWERDGQTHTELAERLHVHPATLSKMVRRMAKAGFVESRPDAEDQRVSRVYLEEAGRAVKPEVRRVEESLEKETLAGFSEEERKVLREYLNRIRDNLIRASEDEAG